MLSAQELGEVPVRVDDVRLEFLQKGLIGTTGLVCSREPTVAAQRTATEFLITRKTGR